MKFDANANDSDCFRCNIQSSTSYRYQEHLFRLRFSFHKLLNNSDEDAGNIGKSLSKLKPIKSIDVFVIHHHTTLSSLSTAYEAGVYNFHMKTEPT